MDDMAVIPYSLDRAILGTAQLTRFSVKVDQSDHMDTVMAKLERFLGETIDTSVGEDELENGTNIAADTAKLAARYAADVCSAAAAVEAGLADMAVPAAGVRAAVVSALDMLSTKRTQRLPKKHGNMSL